MIIEKRVSSSYNHNKKILVTHLNGEVCADDVEQWIRSYHEALRQIPIDTHFKIFVDLNGFKADSLETHKKMRTVIPTSLAEYGHMVGYIKLFEPQGIPTSVTDGKKCIAAAHLHHDETKINLYRSSFAQSNELFTTDYHEAEDWIERF
jgi:hypothetical protein